VSQREMQSCPLSSAKRRLAQREMKIMGAVVAFKQQAKKNWPV